MSVVNNNSPQMIGENTQVQVFSQGITYSNPGITYSNPGIKYGGIYNITQDIVPTISLAENIIPQISTINDEGRGFTVPILSLAKNINPTVYGYVDIYTPGTLIPPSSGKNGPGWFMFINLT